MTDFGTYPPLPAGSLYGGICDEPTFAPELKQSRWMAMVRPEAKRQVLAFGA